MNQNEYGAFCELYGKTLRNKVLEQILERGRLDFAVSDLLEEINISKPKLYEIIRELEETNILVKSRIVGPTQLFLLNTNSQKVRLLNKNFKECLKLIIETVTTIKVST
ncbi:hypothetical protein HN587_07085 [Candidatus Woesearchaeota archaeon]|jgi:hypothetical protein|nr:hypothetical protein [Candidatus Woesearchaeota archaeon]